METRKLVEPAEAILDAYSEDSDGVSGVRPQNALLLSIVSGEHSPTSPGPKLHFGVEVDSNSHQSASSLPLGCAATRSRTKPTSGDESAGMQTVIEADAWIVTLYESPLLLNQ